jgi:hypothetical protein
LIVIAVGSIRFWFYFFDKDWLNHFVERRIFADSLDHFTQLVVISEVLQIPKYFEHIVMMSR